MTDDARLSDVGVTLGASPWTGEFVARLLNRRLHFNSVCSGSSGFFGKGGVEHALLDFDNIKSVVLEPGRGPETSHHGKISVTA